MFRNTIEAGEILNEDAEFQAEMEEVFAKIDPGLRLGQEVVKDGVNYGPLLREWKYKSDQLGDTHRHISHLVGLYPGDQISPFIDETYSNAAKAALINRGDGGTGWARAWKIGTWARLLDGNHAKQLLDGALNLTNETVINMNDAGGIYENLLDAHPPFQIDGNFGATAGIAEMLLQSYMENIHLLPALPDDWSSGSVKGLSARGGFTVDFTWESKEITGVTVTSNKGEKAAVKADVFADKDFSVTDQSGNAVDYVKEGDTIVFATTAGTTYKLAEKAALPETDKTELQKLYDENKDREQGGYTDESYSAFKDALLGAQKVLENENATQDEINAAQENLQAAVSGLVVDKTALKDLIDAAQRFVDDGTVDGMVQSAKEIYLDTLETAKEVLGNAQASYEEVLDIQTKLAVCITTVSMQAGNKTALGMLLESAGYFTDEVLEGYLQEGQAEFKAALKEAQTVYEDGDAFEDEVKAAYDKLFEAMTALRMKPDKDALKALIEQAEEINQSDYTQESYQEVKVVLAAALAVYDDAQAEESEVKAAEEKLQKALDGLVKVPESPGEETPDQGKDPVGGSDGQGASVKDNGVPPKTGDSTLIFGGMFAGLLVALSVMLGIGYCRKKRGDIR